MASQTDPARDEYRGRNAELFHRRSAAATHLADAASPAQQRRRKRELDDINAEIIALNFGLVRSYTRKFTRLVSAEQAEDIEAAGRLGLIQAINTYDPSGGNPFGVWAGPWIKRPVLEAACFAQGTRLSQGDFEAQPWIRDVQALLRAAGKTDPGYEEIAARAGVSVSQVARVLEAQPHRSLDEDAARHGRGSLADRLANREEPELSRYRDVVQEIVDSKILTDQELIVFFRRGGGVDGSPRQTLEQIGLDLGTSRQWAQRHEKKMLAKLKTMFPAEGVRSEGNDDS